MVASSQEKERSKAMDNLRRVEVVFRPIRFGMARSGARAIDQSDRGSVIAGCEACHGLGGDSKNAEILD